MLKFIVAMCTAELLKYSTILALSPALLKPNARLFRRMSGAIGEDVMVHRLPDQAQLEVLKQGIELWSARQRQGLRIAALDTVLDLGHRQPGRAQQRALG